MVIINLSNGIDNSFATGNVSGGSNVGGLIGYYVGTSTLTNNWWYNSLSNGIGNNGFNISVGHWQEATSASDFFNTAQAVYNGSGPWDFTNVWVAPGAMYPDLIFSYNIWSGSGNWSDAANWSKDVVPTATSKVLFNGTSLDDSTINSFGGSIAKLVITSGYTGSIAQNSNLSVLGDYVQAGGTFVSNLANTFTVDNSFSLSGGTFNRFTGLGTGVDPYLVYDVYGLQAIGRLSIEYLWTCQ